MLGVDSVDPLAPARRRRHIKHKHNPAKLIRERPGACGTIAFLFLGIATLVVFAIIAGTIVYAAIPKATS